MSSQVHLIMGAVSPVDTTPGPVPVYRALKNPPLNSWAARNEFSHQVQPTPVNSHHQHNRDIGLRVHWQNAESPWSARPWDEPLRHDREDDDLETGTSTTRNRTATGESLWSSEKPGPQGTASAVRKECQRPC